MSRRFLLLTLLSFLCIPATLLSQDSDNNNRDRQTQRSSGQQFQMQSFVGQTMFFIDQVGLEFLSESVPNADYFDRSSYVIGPQDVLNVNITGPVSINAQALVVNSSGVLFIPYGGNVDVAGLTIEEAYREIESAVAEELVDFDLSVHIQKPRPVEVQIIGDIPNAGRFVLPAGTRLDAAVNAAISTDETPLSPGRSSASQFNFSFQDRIENQRPDSLSTDEDLIDESKYSLRNIRIKSKWLDVLKTGDLVSYFMSGNRSKNPYLYDGDQIYIRKLNENSPRISISGAVDSPNEYEYRSDDTIQTLLNISGGFIDGADSTSIKLYRRTDGQTTEKIISLEDEESIQEPLRENDRVVVSFKSDANRSSSAWVYGEANTPGNFPIDNDETTIAELIEYAGGTTSRALTNGAYMIRSNMTDRGVQSATTLNTSQLMRTSDQVLQGFEYLEMERDLNSDQRMFIDLESNEQLNNITVTDGDRIYIPRDYKNVILYGQFNNPGNYPYDSSLSISDYIDMAGGMSIAADPERIFVIKAGSRSWKRPGETNLESGDMIFVDRTPFDELNAQREYDLQLRSAKRNNVQIILSAVSTVAAVVTTYVAITR